MKRQMTVGKKFLFTSGGLIAAAALLGGVSIYNLARLNEKTQAIINDPMPGMARMSHAEAAFLELRGDVWRHIGSPDAAEKASMERSIEDLKGQVERDLQEYEKTILTSEDRALFDKIGPAWKQYLAAIQEPLALSHRGKNAEASKKARTDATAAVNAAKAALTAESEFNRQNGEKYAADSQQTYKRALWTLGITLALCASIGSVLAFAIVRSLNRTLHQIVTELSEGAEQVASAASQVASASQSLAQGSSEQAASLEETSASSEEINSMARKNTENSHSAAGVMTQSQQKFVEANQFLEQMVVAMGEINSQSDKISKIIKVIDEIAFQTNILALNAAVEAARAGEAGMGFAVVADEVRSLAQRCAQAAKDTSALIEESIAKSNDGKAKVDQVASSIRSITQESVQVKTLVDEVNVGSEEQARGIEQISKAITQMEQVTQKTAANAEESASAAEELNAQSETLKDVVDQLTALVGGADSGRRGRVKTAVNRSAATPAQPSRPPASPKTGVPEPVLAAAHSSKNGFPLDTDFKEF